MGSKSSKSAAAQEQAKKPTFAETMQQKIDDEITRRMMLQREVQMAVNIAKARDSLYIFGSVWLTLVSGVSTAVVLKKPVNHVVAVPIVIGGIMLSNMADMAYGNKLARVNKEAEYILDNERARLVPFPQAPMARFYSAQERSVLYDPATAVGDMFPYQSITRSFTPEDTK
eukprot:CAMPEP_0198114416 /NCGR_PEP_ID=MMETSP1442-20131203/5810_1 /TAXON_ID= /ORGANISM="Craspedostauros australis, Strain CCMP3328" /LENGTH=170 /DNA_ID=CAMNT_0043771723 /DNA_START=138 /DNA_END=650 /DNA_ORIENTATION=+